MAMSRRRFLAGAGAGGVAYAFNLSCASPSAEFIGEGMDGEFNVYDGAEDRNLDYRNWLLITAEGGVTAHTGRTELGQGLTTVLYDVICQGLELPRRRVRIVMGETVPCPHDGPTTGSGSTVIVGWGYWHACKRIRFDLVARAAVSLGCEPEELEYHKGEIRKLEDPATRIAIGDLGDGSIRVASFEASEELPSSADYLDQATTNVNAEEIVTGSLQYTGDLDVDGCLYGDYLRSPFHAHLSSLTSADLRAAEDTPGLVHLEGGKRSVVALGRTPTSVWRALAAVKAEWSERRRPRQLDNEQEIRSGAERVTVVREQGDIDAGLAACEHSVSETYITQYASHVPIETETVLAHCEADRTTVWAGT